MKHRRISMFLVAGMALILTSCHKQQPQQTAPISVVAETVSNDAADLSTHYVGIVEEKTSNPVSFVGSGTLQKVYVEEGQAVRKGQLLAEMDATQTRNMLAAAQAQYDQATDALARLRQVHDAGSLPEMKWVEVQSQVAQAKSQLDIARKSLEDCRIYAPVNGVVGSLNFHAGSVVLTSEPVMSLLDISTVKVRVSIPEREISSIAPSTRSTVNVEATGRSYEGGRIEKGVSADAMSRTYDIRIHVGNADRKLLPGMVADVVLAPDGNRSDASAPLTLPVRCIQQRSGGQRFVWVADGGKAKACNVTTAQTVGNRIVIADGLKGGEQVIVEGWQKVGEGTSVKVSQSGK